MENNTNNNNFIKCSCGKTINKKNKSRHLLTSVHLNYIKNNDNNDNTDNTDNIDELKELENEINELENNTKNATGKELQRTLIKHYEMMLVYILIKQKETDETFDPIKECDIIKEKVINILELKK